MKKTIDSIQIKIADKYPVDKKFDFDQELVVFLKGEIVKREVFNNQDGSVKLVLTFKALDFEIKEK